MIIIMMMMMVLHTDDDAGAAMPFVVLSCLVLLTCLGLATAGDSGVLRALKRLLLKRRAGLESHLRDVAHEAVKLGATTTCRKVGPFHK